MKDMMEMQLKGAALLAEHALVVEQGFKNWTARVAKQIQLAHQKVSESQNRIEMVAEELPKRGWYLSGHDPVSLYHELADYLDSGDLAGVDRRMVDYASTLQKDIEPAIKSLTSRGVAHYTADRLRLFWRLLHGAEHTAATLVGLPLVDELVRAVYGNRADFSSKGRDRQKREKPLLGIKDPRRLQQPDCVGQLFLNQVGSVQAQVDPAKFEDEDYFSRHAMLHGQMRRAYGIKDSAKTALIIVSVLQFAESPSVEAR
ncbi:MAG: hypothetical protein K8J08_05250 [Thermoanaerobaculia bacterium]|nr:hypothetical protein [Thermoanaerobaculia bacterium]